MSEKLLSVRQAVELAPDADEVWLRRRINAGEVKIVRTGYNYLIPVRELPKIIRLAAARPKFKSRLT